MLGYVKAFKPELKMKDYEVYKGVYCSLCKRLGRMYSPFAQLMLSYDFVFLALVRMSVSPVCPSFQKNRCHYNPLVKCSTCCMNNNELDFCADAAVIMSYYKLRDNIRDGGFFKKTAMYILFPAVSFMYKKARKRSGEADTIISLAMTEQNSVEDSSSCGIDMAAEPTARALSEIFASGESDEQQRIVLERLGYLVGRWVYIIDSVDDLADDIKQKCFNPLIPFYIEFKNKGQLNDFEDYVRHVLDTTAGEAVNAFHLLETKRFRAILENILYDGLANTTGTVLNKNRRWDSEKSV